MSYQTHLDRFGLCECKRENGTEMLELEVSDGYGRYRFEKIKACSDCYGFV